MSFVYVILGFILLVVGGEYLVRSSVALSFKFNISKLVIGLTVVSFATSAPELLVSLQAAFDGSSDISLGNVIGSNIANIGLVLGITAIISPLAISKDFYKFNWPVMMLLSFMLYFFLKSNKNLSTLEGFALFFSLIIFLIVLIRKTLKESKSVYLEEVDDALKLVSNLKIGMWFIIGSLALYYGSEWLVQGAKEIAANFGVSERVISVTMVAVGTSIPELAASVIAALKKEKAISLGNLIGSNIFNISSVLGITAMIQPITLNDERLLTNDIFWMLGFSFVLIPLVFISKKFQLSKLEGAILFIAYGVFVFMAFS